MSDKFFLGGVTPNGFSTDLGKYVNSKDYFTYILKGGAGTGKSTLMKRIAERFANTEDVTRYFCSSDPDSLDAVVLHSSKAVIIDGTAPHVFDPKYPGVCQKIVDLGFYWDKNMLAKNSDRIIKASDSNKQLLLDASNSAKALGRICEDTFSLGSYCLDTEKLEAFAQRLCRKILGRKRSSEASVSTRQLSAMTQYGYMTFTETLDRFDSIYCLRDDRFCAAGRLLSLVAEQAVRKGYDVSVSPYLIFEDTVYEHLLIDGAGTALITSAPLNRLTVRNAGSINMSRFYDREALKEHRGLFTANASLIRQLSELTAKTMKQAKAKHDELESYYIKAMDFDGLDRVCESISGEIAFRSKR